MFVYKKENQLPIKSWIPEKDYYADQKMVEQVENLSKLPFAFRHIVLAPDGHVGYGMPIGGVLASKDVIVPNAVGVDIGCGMNFCLTNIKWTDIKNTVTTDGLEIRKAIIGNIRKNIPVGFNHHKEPQVWAGFSNYPNIPILVQENQSARYQLGSLGGGNHFIELQSDKDGNLAIMIHSGSRNLGKKICDRYNALAEAMNAKWYSKIDPAWELAYFPIDSDLGVEYITAMNYALEFAKASRELMMERTKNVVFNMLKKYANVTEIKELMSVDVHHNYAAIEAHFGESVMVHRKGATSAKFNELGLIPGSQGTKSYVVRGRGNTESFMSCSHGAGRRIGRKQAQRELDLEVEKKKLNDQDIVHEIRNQADLDEAPGSYKDIVEVMSNQTDLVDIVNELTPLAVIKG
jgi:tRNA-splicing ligase RtcB (3'-phosphate/5'-hydroxy nucleic acid ligase)